MLPDPRLLPYINNNEPFPSFLGVYLQAYLGSLDQRLRDYDTKLATLEEEFKRDKNVLQATRSERNKLFEERRRYQHVTAAIRRLPPEVVAPILRYALTSGYGIAGGGGRALSKHDREYFAGLRSVCRLWRMTAFTTPDLWRYLSVVLQYNPSSGSAIDFGRRKRTYQT
jgi:F-box-like